MSNLTFKKQPKGLFWLMGIYMCQYYNFFGVRALLILYLTQGLMLDDNLSYSLYGSYVALLYLVPIFGGFLADRLLGYKYTVLLGIICMAIGSFIICLGEKQSLYLGMVLMIVGNGYFIGNLQCMLSQFYDDNDSRRDAGFTLLFLGGNIGGLLAHASCAVIAYLYGWQYGFGATSIGMILGFILFIVGNKHLSVASNKISVKMILYSLLITLLIIVLIYFVLRYQLESYILLIASLICIVWFINIFIKSSLENKNKLYKVIIFIIFGIVFWAFNEQFFTSVELFVQRATSMSFLGIFIPAGSIRTLDPFAIIIGGLFFVFLSKLLKIKKNANLRLLKFNFGLFLQFISFSFLVIATIYINANGQSLIVWVLVAVFMLGLSELFIDPIALSEITSINNKKDLSFLTAMYMMFTGSVSGYLGAKIASMASFKNFSSTSDLAIQIGLFKNLFVHIAMTLLVICVIWLGFTLTLHIVNRLKYFHR